jgi:predicted metal-dependent hydrolase
VHSVQYGTQTITYDIQRKPTLKNTYINVDKEGVLIKTNTRTTEQEIEAFILKKSSWILRHLQAYKRSAHEEKIETGSRLYYLGKSYYVQLLKKEQKGVEVSFSYAKFIITAPANVTQPALYKAIDSFYKNKAAQKILPLAEKWAAAMEVSPAHISFRRAQKRWGSCSPTDRITFNYHLMKLPTSLIEYVIVHELAHICCKNHSQAFWSLVGKFIPDYREKEEKIKAFEKLF